MTNKELTGVSKMNETAANILSFLSERRRNTVYTAFSGLRADMKKKFGKEVNRKEFDDTFKQLATIGAGGLECSKRGVCLGFNWTMPIRQIAVILKGVQKVEAPAAKEEPKKEIKKEVKAAEAPTQSKPVTLIIIRRNRAHETIETDEAHVASLRPARAPELSQ